MHADHRTSAALLALPRLRKSAVLAAVADSLRGDDHLDVEVLPEPGLLIVTSRDTALDVLQQRVLRVQADERVLQHVAAVAPHALGAVWPQHGGGTSSPRPAPLLPLLRRAGLLPACSPLHDPPAQQRLHARSSRRLLLPAASLRSYLGDQGGFYAAFLNFLATWLVAPAAVAAVLQAALWQTDGNEADSPLVPLAAAFTVLWAGVGLKAWRRHSAALALRWGGSLAEDHAAAVRPEFRGYLRRNPFTGEVEAYYPRAQRAVRVAASAAATLALMGLGLAMLVVLMNLQVRWPPLLGPSTTLPVMSAFDTDSQGLILPAHAPLHMPWLARCSHPGGAFEPGTLLANVPTGVRVVATALFVQRIYSPVVSALVAWENQRTRGDHEDSLLLKRAALQALLAYAPILYLGLGTGNALAARRDLAGFYSTEWLRRLAMEVALPLLTYAWTSRRRRRGAAVAAAPAGASLAGAPARRPEQGHPAIQGAEARGAAWSSSALAAQALEDAAKPDWDPFEDLAELASDFGYIVMFAAAFPLAPLIALAHTAVKLRADRFKLLRLCRRAWPVRAAGIGRWATVLTVQVYLAALTNTLLAGLSAAQLAPLLPGGSARLAAAAATAQAAKQGLEPPPEACALPGRPLDDTTRATHMLVLFGLEHALLLALLAIQLLVPSTSEAVRAAAAAAQRGQLPGAGHAQARMEPEGSSAAREQQQ